MHLQRWPGWRYVRLLPSRLVLCTPYNHAPFQFMQSHVRKVHAYLAVTCYLHFWQNDRDLLRATAVTRGWSGYWNKRQYIKFTLEMKILSQLLKGLEPATFQSRVRRSSHWAIPDSTHTNSVCVYLCLSVSSLYGSSCSLWSPSDPACLPCAASHVGGGWDPGVWGPPWGPTRFFGPDFP